MNGSVDVPGALPSYQLAHLKLALVPQLGPRRTRLLIEHFGTPEAALEASEAELKQIPNLGAKRAAEFAAAFRGIDEAVRRECEQLARHDVRLVTWGEEDYPEALATIADAPMLLYLRGTLSKVDAASVGIVGSRSCTAYGKRIAHQIASGLALASRPVVSGLARGIDGAAHRGALEVRGRTIAVLAGGLATIYPPEHKELADEIVARGGLLLTETPMTVGVQPGMFPARNRIISGLSQGIVVVEANIGSGALITVDHAADQGREVFVVPGAVDNTASAGCLDLIRKGARLVRNAADILEDLQALKPTLPPVERPAAQPTRATQPPPAPTRTPVPANLPEAEQALWDALTQPRHADELTRMLNLSAAQLTVLLMKLEMKKLIKRQPGNQFARL